MQKSQDHDVAIFDRFGWYWQPASWLEHMSSQDAITATKQAIDIQVLAKTLLQQVAKNEVEAAVQRRAMQQMLNSLEKD